MNEKRKSLISKLNQLAIVPLVFLGISVLVIASYSVYEGMVAETENGLKILAYSLHDSCSFGCSGDYVVIGDTLTKNGQLIDSNGSNIDKIREISGNDVTIFYGNMRVLTSVRNPDGSRAFGTKAQPEVMQAVLQEGKDYFSSNIEVNGTPYFGYYTPLRNSDQSIVGMIFVGKVRQVVVDAMLRTILRIFIVMVVAIAAASAVSLFYAKKIIYSLQKTKEFLGSVVQGDIESKIDPYLLRRSDEIGEMGRFAVDLQKMITDQVCTDPLTGLYNRRCCGVIFANAMKGFEKHKTPFAIALGDIDWFKSINDTYGHDCGDTVLKELSAVITEHMENKGFAFRWGGEEFLLIYEKMKKEQAVTYLEELLDAIRTITIAYEENMLSFTMTFGLVEYAGQGNIESIVRQADDNLYQGKETGKNQVVFS